MGVTLDTNAELALLINQLVDDIHADNLAAGWWNDPETGQPLRATILELLGKMMLVDTEMAEAAEGLRKNLMDDKLPHRKMVEVELADAVIRICDLAGKLKLDLGGAIMEKRAFNKVRPDHKIENRLKDGGKKA